MQYIFGLFGACHALAHICSWAGPWDLSMKHSSNVHKHAAERIHMEHTDLRDRTLQAVNSSSPTQSVHIFTFLHRTVDTYCFIAMATINNIPTHCFPEPTTVNPSRDRHRGDERGNGPEFENWRLQQRHCVRLLGFCWRPLLIKHGRAQSVCEQFGRFRAGSVNHSHYQTIWDETSRQRPLGWTLIIWRGQSGLNQLETPVAWAQTKTPVVINL